MSSTNSNKKRLIAITTNYDLIPDLLGVKDCIKNLKLYGESDLGQLFVRVNSDGSECNEVILYMYNEKQISKLSVALFAIINRQKKLKTKIFPLIS